jgi:hypothetical protein
VPHQTTLHLINNFVLQTTRFLNRFSNVCEEKLATVSRDIQGLEISLSIIESKLDIKGLSTAPPGVPRAAVALSLRGVVTPLLVLLVVGSNRSRP